MASRMQAYEVKRRDNLADPNFWNPRFADIDGRLNAREQDSERIEGAIDELEAVALQRLNDTFTPLIVEAQGRLNNLGASFSAESLEEHTIGLGLVSFTLTEETAANYVYTDYIQARSATDSANSMLGQVISFDRAFRLLNINVVHVEGSGTFSDWLIRVGAPLDLTHADRTDNPHHTTAAQVGAYTYAEADAATIAAIDALAPLSTALAKAQNLADLPDKAAARVNIGLGALAVLATVGTGEIAASVWATIAQIRSKLAGKGLQVATLFDAAAYVALTDAAPISWDMDNGFNFSVTLAASRTLSFPLHPKPGQSGFIDVTQSASGNCSLGFAAGYKFDQGVVPTLDLAASRTTSIYYFCASATEVRVAVAFKGVR